MSTPDVNYIKHLYPLIDLDMSRDDCVTYWQEHYPDRELHKSACVGCPFRSIREWITIYEKEPSQFQKACEIDEAIRNVGPDDTTVFLHQKRIPLRQAVELDIQKIEELDRKQALSDSQLTLWDSECTGFCGV